MVRTVMRRLLALPRLDEIHQRLADGQAPDFVAKVIRDEMRCLVDVSATTVGDTLRAYRAQVIGLVLAPESAVLLEAERGDLDAQLRKRLKSTVDLFERSEWLINVLTYRAELVLRMEEATGVRQDVVRDLDLLRQALRDYVQLQLETGRLRRVPIELKSDVNLRTLDMTKLLEADARSRQELRNAAELALKMVRGELPPPVEEAS